MRVAVARVVGVALAVVAGDVGGAVDGGQQQRPTFRSGTELVLIDTQVVARDGTPIQGLKPEQFEVFIDGRRRPIVSAEFVRAVDSGAASPGALAAPGVTAAPTPTGRTIILAIDQTSFPMTAQWSAREAARRVIDRVAPEDALGLVAFPGKLIIAPTRDRKPIRDAISQIAGLRLEITSSQFNLSATEAVLLRSRDSVATREITSRECQTRQIVIDLNCPREVIQDGARIADALEQQGMQTIDGLHAVIDGVATLPGRKTLIVVSAGLPTSNRPGGRPNLDGETDRIARRAAAANVNLYVFYMNVHFLRSFSPEYGKRNYSIFEDITTFATGLERFADSAGGAFFQVEVDSDPFVARALRETTATYLLAVQAEPADHDGKEHFIRVAVRQRGATVRYRRVVTIPALKNP